MEAVGTGRVCHSALECSHRVSIEVGSESAVRACAPAVGDEDMIPAGDIDISYFNTDRVKRDCENLNFGVRGVGSLGKPQGDGEVSRGLEDEKALAVHGGSLDTEPS